MSQWQRSEQLKHATAIVAMRPAQLIALKILTLQQTEDYRIGATQRSIGVSGAGPLSTSGTVPWLARRIRRWSMGTIERYRNAMICEVFFVTIVGVAYPYLPKSARFPKSCQPPHPRNAFFSYKCCQLLYTYLRRPI